MRHKHLEDRAQAPAIRRSTPFCGLGLAMEAVFARSVRLMRSQATPGTLKPRLPRLEEPARPWGGSLLVALGRFTRAG